MRTVSRSSLLATFLLAASPLAAESTLPECPTVEQAGFTVAMAARDTVNTLEKVPSGPRHLFFFTDVRGGRGQTLIHQWQHGGSETSVRLRVNGDSWRAWSSQPLHSPHGDWRVSVLTEAGCELGQWRLPGATVPPVAVPAPVPRVIRPAEDPAPARQVAAPPRLDETALQALLADNDVIGLRMLLQDAETRGVDPKQIDRLRNITLVLASARREVEHDRLHTARTRLMSLAARDDLTEEEQDSLAALQARAQTRARQLSQEYLYWMAAWDTTVNRGLAGSALCTDPSGFANDWPAHINESLAWVDRQETGSGYRFVLLDHRTAESHVLTLHCPFRALQGLREGDSRVSQTATGG